MRNEMLGLIGSLPTIFGDINGDGSSRYQRLHLGAKSSAAALRVRKNEDTRSP